MRRTFVLMLVAAIALVGCGGGGGSKSSSTTAASAASGSSSATTAKPASSNAAPSLGGGKFCTDAATNNLAQQLAASSAAAGAGTAALQRNLDLLKTYESEAPSAIKADVTTLVTFYTKFVQIMTNDKSDPSKLGTDLQGVEVDQAALQAASQHIGAYYAANCHA